MTLSDGVHEGEPFVAGGAARPRPDGLGVGPVGSTRMACPPALMEAEGRYLSALAKVSRFSFVNGHLALSHQEGDVPDTMLFALAR